MNIKIICGALITALACASCNVEKHAANGNDAAPQAAAETGQGVAMESLQWSENFDSCIEESKKSGKPVFALFTGSDWCHWCRKLENEVFSKSEFASYANRHYVMFKADYPDKLKQLDFVRRQNETLAKRFGIKGFPTVLILDSDGNVLAAGAYAEGGPEAYIRYLEELTAENTMKR